MTDTVFGGVSVRVLRLHQAWPVQVPLLQEPEHARASRFLHRKDAESFLAGRVALRCFAADLAGVPAESLTARYRCPMCGDTSGDHGRPGYDLGDGAPGPLVSLSRAGSWLVLAGAVAGRSLAGLGVDAEHAARTGFEGFDGFLAPREASSLELLTPAGRLRQRARLWARKEAFVKALGVGLTRDPASVDITDNIVEGVQLLDLENRLLGLPSGMVAALAVRPGPVPAGRSAAGC
jgi:4'-phosphopantetheinyl transferase